MKIGLVIEGGGMKCAYSAGVLDGFLEDDVCFDYCIGVSAGSANATSYLAKQKNRNLRFYTEHIKDPQYAGISTYIHTGQVFSLQYIYGDMTNSDGKDPIDYQALKNNPCEFEIVATNSQNGQPTYFDGHKMPLDHYDMVMASSALPIFCQPINIDGIDYFDGGISDAIPYERAFFKGCDKVVVILSKPRDYLRQPQKGKLFYKNKLKDYPHIIKDIENRYLNYRRQFAGLKVFENTGEIFVFAPDSQIKVSTFTMDPKVEKQLYDNGLNDYCRLKDALNQFLEK